MKIALVPSSYDPITGGVEEMTRNLASRLRDCGNQVEVWTANPGMPNVPTNSFTDGITVRRFDFYLPGARIRSVLQFPVRASQSFLSLRRTVRLFRPDVIHVQCFGPNGAYMTVLSALAAIPLIVTLHGETVMDDQDIFTKSSTLRIALRAGIRRAYAVTGCSQFTIDDAVARFGLKEGRGRVIFNGVPLEEGRAAGGSAGPSPTDRYLFALGRFVHKKGFDLLLRAYVEVAERHPDVSLIIGGDGPDRPAIESLASELGIADRVIFTGRLTRPAVLAAMSGAELFVMPSRIEPFGIVILEAWRSGTAVVASSLGGPREFVRDGVDGVLIDPFDTNALASNINRLLENPAERIAIAGSGQKRVLAFSWAAIAAEYMSLYEDVAASR